MNTEFDSLLDLYNKVYPALTTKKRDLYRLGRTYIKEEDIWNCLKEYKWKITNNLTLSEMVNDILECDLDMLDNYIKKQISLINRKIDLDNN